MARYGRFNISGFQDFQKKMEKLQNPDEFVKSCAKELAARLLAKVIKRTPVGDYSKEIEVVAKRDSKHHRKGEVYTKRINPGGKKGGTLRRGWTGGERSTAKDYAESLTINHFDNTYVIEITNPVEYAPYVEYGHRTANHKGWVPGRFMMTISEQELEAITHKILENKIKKYLKECMK